jgi:hypothetical protein
MTDMLAAVLKYHIIPQSLPAAALTKPAYTTLVGSSVYVTTKNNGTVYVNQAKVVKANIAATNNSYIHMIDAVLMKEYMPPTTSPQPKLTSAAGGTACMSGAIASFVTMVVAAALL